MDETRWDLMTRILHWGLALTISAQLISGLLVPDPQTRAFFYFHEWDGLAASTVIFVVWLWIYSIQDFGTLFPWNRAGMQAVGADIRGLFRGMLPSGGPNHIGLASFWHGLGILAVTGMAITGVWIFFVIPGGHGASGSSTDFHEYMQVSWLHKMISYFVWAYLIGHISFAILHQKKGAPIFRGIFYR
ncbi:cytochrome b/b6 domain-containing protein [Acidiferrobacter sp.]|uniref:cytochrome b/b6 domain-containing protein n=1 Tax=Acidiferrobacter sp. TaxID=1872107 RepID=UPI0026186515|nr:cytochrome b/b6 domain-containing protein [Acidiferrobacter sp.]